MADLFGKLKETIDKSVTTVSAKSKELVESSKLKNQLATLQIQKKDSLEELGNIIYIMIKKEQIEEQRLRDKCSIIKKIDDDIAEKENQLREIHMKTQEEISGIRIAGVCECGTQLLENAKFCGKCGKKIDRPPIEPV